VIKILWDYLLLKKFQGQSTKKALLEHKKIHSPFGKLEAVRRG
jgi:hypothetical protein